MPRPSRHSLARTVAGGLLVGLLAVFVAAGPAAADTAVTVLAAEGGEDAEAPGPDPMPPDASPNPAAPLEYESNFLWGAAVGLLVLTVFAVLGVGGLYYLLVVRPRQREDASA